MHVATRQYEAMDTARTPGVSGLAGLTALVVDDSKLSRDVLTTVLSTLGVGHVHVASDGLEGLHMLSNSTPSVDIVLCDWDMPEVSGLELLTDLRQRDKHLPFIMITGKSDALSVATASAAGASAFLAKPYSPRRLTRVLAEVVADL